MKYFKDTEFNEGVVRGFGARDIPTITLISIGIVAEDGREYYAESSAFKDDECNEWVQSNVLPLLGTKETRKTRRVIRDEILSFVGDDPEPEFWAYYADYDWVVFCWLFGSMIDLPDHFPMMCMDLQQEFMRLGKPEGVKPPDPAHAHNALADARWNKRFHEALGTRPSEL